MPRPATTRLVACLLLSLSGITIPASGALASSQPDPGTGTLGVRLVPSPGAPSGDPLAHSYIVASVAPGARLTRRIEISNTTTDPLPVLAYAAAASMEPGGFSFADGRTQNDLSS